MNRHAAAGAPTGQGVGQGGQAPGQAKKDRLKQLAEDERAAASALVAVAERIRDEVAAAAEELKQLQARVLTLPSGERVLLPAQAEDGQLLCMPDGRTYRLVEGTKAVVQLTDG